MIAAVAMYFLTQTPLGRMANACRDNFERAQFVGYDPRMVRFLQFALSGFFAGIGGGLYAITYEIVTFDAVKRRLSANALLMAYIGGAACSAGPILGAVLITLLQSGVSLTVQLLADLCRRAVHRHGDLRAGRPRRADPGAPPDLARRPAAALAVPYLRVVPPALVAVVGFVGLVELASFLTIGAAQGKPLALFGTTRSTSGAAAAWLAAAVLLARRGGRCDVSAPSFAAAWAAANAESRAQAERADECPSGALRCATSTRTSARPRSSAASALDDPARASVTRIIGPNGAGKTTLFNLISGPLSGVARARSR